MEAWMVERRGRSQWRRGQRDANNSMGSQQLKRTTATSREGSNKGRQTTVWDASICKGHQNQRRQQHQSREGSNKGTETTVWEASICSGRQQQRDANSMESQQLQRTTAIVGKVAPKGRKQLYGKPAFANDDSNSREGSNKRGCKQQYGKPAFAKVATKGRKQLYGKPAFAEDDSNTGTLTTVWEARICRGHQQQGTQTTVWEASICRGLQQKQESQLAAPVFFNLKYQRRNPFKRPYFSNNCNIYY